MKDAKKALETSSLGRNPRLSLSQLIQSVVITSTTTEVKVNRTVLEIVKYKKSSPKHILKLL